MRIQLMMTAAALAFLPAGAMAQTYNSTPDAGWQFGNSNDYDPANTAVLDIGANQLYLRWHETHYGAPASTGDTYQFAAGSFNLPSDSLSFDWGFSVNPELLGNLTAHIDITDLGTGLTYGYDALGAGNDNYNVDGTVQNSARLSFGFLLGNAFDPDKNDTYKVTLSVTGIGDSPRSLTTYAQVGTGASTGAVPEPASWAMMVGGFGLIGAAMRRRRTAGVFA
jgi:hypothetical protein